MPRYVTERAELCPYKALSLKNQCNPRNPCQKTAFPRMRIKKAEIKILKESVRESDPDAEIYLFGSRTNDQARGGDIDILVLSQRLTFKDQIKIKARIFKSLEEQAIHLVIARDMTDPFVRVALNEGVPL